MSELQPLKAGLAEHGLWANKKFGQHFLLDPSINARIAAFADVSGKTVLEIGPGPGGLTRALLEAGAARVVAIEKDTRFLPMLQPLIAWSGGRLAIVPADAVEVVETALLGDAREASIVSNLPYNVATPLLVKWLKAGAWRGPMTLMFQKEVAERIVAGPGEKAYGRLAVLAQSVCVTEIVMRLPPGAFTPPPQVDSAVVRLEPLSAPFDDLATLERVTGAAFGQRRKMLRASLKKLGDAEHLLNACAVQPTARGEELAVAKFLELARALRGR